jgi:catechol 2,3-dioxygenase-like lactoylglutathione lyase family enzyme
VSRGLYIGLSSVDSHNRSNLRELTSPVIMTAATTQASSPIRIVRLAHMRYRHANIAQTQEFLEDFGMRLAYKEGNHRFYFAGDGPDPFVYVAEVVGLSLIIGLLASRSIGYIDLCVQGERSEFLGGTFLVETKEDLERASQLIPGATSLQSAGPAGGYMVTFRDPDGIPCNLAWGLAGKAVNEETTIPLVNFPTAKPRRGEFIRCVERNLTVTNSR